MTYVGESNQETLRHGKGTYVYANRYFQYSGDWIRGKCHGHGMLLLGDSSTYEGEFVEGEIQGQGTRRWPDGSTYRGTFEEGIRHGAGVYISASGEHYEGDFIQNQYSGKGIWTLSNLVYEGDFRSHQFSGFGKLTCEGSSDSDSYVYQGMWNSGKYHGEGLLAQSKLEYRGQFLMGVKQGVGTLMSSFQSQDSPKELVYQGEWQNDQPKIQPTHIWITLEDEAVGNISSDLPTSLLDQNVSVTFILAIAADEFLPLCIVSCLELQHSISCPDSADEEKHVIELKGDSPVDESISSTSSTLKLVTEESQREFLIECFAGVSPHRLEQEDTTSVDKWSIMDPTLPIHFFHLEDVPAYSSALGYHNDRDEVDAENENEMEGLVKTKCFQIKTLRGQATLQGIRLCDESLSFTTTCCFQLLDISPREIFPNRLSPIYIDVDISQ